jgi:hypothetical protein
VQSAHWGTPSLECLYGIPLNEPEWKKRSYDKNFDYVNQNVKRKKPYNSTK